jgi:hypothetical protein
MPVDLTAVLADRGTDQPQADTIMASVKEAMWPMQDERLSAAPGTRRAAPARSGYCLIFSHIRTCGSW